MAKETVTLTLDGHRMEELRALVAHGPVAPETLGWAARLVDEWDTGTRKRHRRAG